MLLQCQFLIYFNTKPCHSLHHWIEHVKISRTVLFCLWKWSLYCFLCKIIFWSAKNHKKTPFLFVSKPDIHFPWWRDIIHKVFSRLETSNEAAVVTKVHHFDQQKQKRQGNRTKYECMWILTRCVCTVPVRLLVGTLGCFSKNKIKIQNLNAKMISNDGQWISNDNGQWTMPLQWHFLVYFNTNTCNALCHWIDHVNISRTVLF